MSYSEADGHIRRELGRQGIVQLKTLQKRLGLGGRQVRFRMAPSIVARSEAELFQVSMPRFVIRGYLGNHVADGFVNLRRVATFADLARVWGKPPSNLPCSTSVGPLQPYPSTRPPGWELRNNSVIADSLLPSTHLQNYHILTAELGTQYGEPAPVVGTPYLNHIHVSGGGLCAQATCMMATSLLYREALGVFGTAEITKLAMQQRKRRDQASSLVLSGLELQDIASYFNHKKVGLGGVWQSTEDMKLSEQGIAFAMRCYLRSGFPIVLPMDLGRMCGIGSQACPVHSHIARENQIQKSLTGRGRLRAFRHSVLVVGCHQSDENRFVFNDPWSFPFLTSDVSSLWDAGLYKADDPKLAALALHAFLPVTPSAVKLPLVNCAPGFTNAVQLGVTAMSSHLRFALAELSNSKPVGRGDFRLLRVKDIKESLMGLSLDEQACNLIRAHVGYLDGNHWVWLEVNSSHSNLNNAVWIWDAQAGWDQTQSLTTSACASICLLVVEAGASGWAVAHSAKAASPARLPEPISEWPPSQVIDSSPVVPAPFRVGVITSFDLHGVRASLERWPKALPAAELYAFVQPDAELLLPIRRLNRQALKQLWNHTLPVISRNLFRQLPHRLQFRGGSTRRLPLGYRWPLFTALDRMAANWDQPEIIQNAARQLHKMFANRGVPVSSIATYLPEIAADGDLATQAKAALRFVLRLTGELRELAAKESHSNGNGLTDIDTVEVVAGSVVQGIWAGYPNRTDPTRSSKHEIYHVANLVKPYVVLSRVMENLLDVISSRPEHVTISVELEPGPLNALNSHAALRTFCKMLDKKGLHPDQISLNLDLGHWMLAGIRPDRVLSDPIIFRRIRHAHISDVGRGHFGDCVLGRLNHPSAYKAWIDLIKRAATGLDSFGVSIEYEGAADPEELDESLSKLNWLFHQ